MMLPRVSLKSSKITPPSASLDSTIEGAIGVWDNNDHVALVIYNMNEDHAICKGVYVWDGNQWEYLNYIDISSETSTSLTDRDGNVYSIHTYGTAGTWMTQNLRTTTDPCGKKLENNHTDGDYTKAVFAYPKLNSTPYISGKPDYWQEKYGLLYSWAAATHRKGRHDGKANPIDEGEGLSTSNNQNNTSSKELKGMQGICPKGWHIPSDKEWNDLKEELIANAALYSDESNASITDQSWRIKQNGYDGKTYGSVMKTPEKVLVNTSGGTHPIYGQLYGSSKTDGFGFNVFMTGRVDPDQNRIRDYGRDATFWSHSAAPNAEAWGFDIYYEKSYQVGSYRDTDDRRNMFSIRCKKDD
ncbi:fibrobacter succinogenes major paralogous domain-containing protein [Dysgonomonas sp. Marseille-P4677]|uniref:fibrobacter succinogenes major paralogous domain-containing protein n=1 Tax=Dysgonomonas sp. Marseille-P4677 TaxID=2364790 RepID=UPI0019144A07|nr:fibrobacter succinogenes major paralogous domain-containing protein [Dysgonomonas sp. Marseille-P4677]MBK5719826.1 fibrobacter succinogenes major paralogous domain-containing protein [Dysgonomonas sp. Marseille-P4677]